MSRRVSFASFLSATLLCGALSNGCGAAAGPTAPLTLAAQRTVTTVATIAPRERARALASSALAAHRALKAEAAQAQSDRHRSEVLERDWTVLSEHLAAIREFSASDRTLHEHSSRALDEYQTLRRLYDRESPRLGPDGLSAKALLGLQLEAGLVNALKQL